MTMITPSYLGETIEYSSLHACRSTLEDPTLEQQTSAIVVSYYWHFVDVVWIGLFTTIYLIH